MEQTLGKRIVTYRKNLGLTQDQLAERLGVTAQAVSKWENDQSCPDITMLPKLAEIFNTSTDVLLGVAPEEPAREATVVDTAQDDPAGDANPNWEFRYDNSRKAGIWFAVGVLVVGGLYLLSSLLELEVGLWDIVWPTALLVFGISGLIPYRRFSFLRVGCILFGGFFLINGLLPMPIRLDNGVIVACIILLIGIGLLADALRRPKKPRFAFTTGDGHRDHTPRAYYSVADGMLRYDAAFADHNQRVATPLLRGGMINTSFGDYEVDLSGVEAVAPDCRLEVNTSFGDLTIWVPSRYQVLCSSSTAFADIEITGKPDAVPAGTIQLIANASFGDITVEYI